QRDSLGYERGRNGGRNTLAYFAWLRCLELIDAGKGSIVPDAPKGQDLKSVLRRPDFPEADLLKSAFLDLRAEADAWQKARTAFMTERLKAGRHPDTDSNFWVGYKEQPAPSLPTQSVPAAAEARRALHVQLTLVLLICVPALLLALLVGWRFTARKQARSRKVPLGNVSPIDPLA